MKLNVFIFFISFECIILYLNSIISFYQMFSFISLINLQSTSVSNIASIIKYTSLTILFAIVMIDELINKVRINYDLIKIVYLTGNHFLFQRFLGSMLPQYIALSVSPLVTGCIKKNVPLVFLYLSSYKSYRNCL